MLNDRKRPNYVTIRPAELMDELMKMSDAEACLMLLQIRNSVLLVSKMIENDPWHLGRLCGMTRHTAAKVIHKLLHLSDPDIYAPKEGWLSSHKAEEILENYQVFREKSSTRATLAQNIEIESEENQRLKKTYVSNKDNKDKRPSIPIPLPSPAHERSLPHPIPVRSRSFQSSGRGGLCHVPSINGFFNIENLLSDQGIKEAKYQCRLLNRDFYALCKVYNQRVNSGASPPPDIPDRAFIGWIHKYTKGEKL